jgi:isoquinoline 1-oxidoreductase beta subunit
VVRGARWVAAVAETSWAADRALGAAAIRFSGPVDADTPAIERALTQALDGAMERSVDDGDYDAAVAGKRPLSAV